MNGFPTAGKKIFAKSKGNRNNATISLPYFNARYYEYYCGYKAVADLAVDAQVSHGNKLPFYSAVYPIIFLYRQFIELYLKEIFLEFSPLEDNEKTNTIRKISHDIIKMWKQVKPFAEQYYLYYTNDWESIIANAEIYLQQLADKDKKSTCFRYPCELPTEDIDLINLKECMDELANFFFSLQETFGYVKDMNELEHGDYL